MISRCLNIRKLDMIKANLANYFSFLSTFQSKDVNELWLVIKSGIIFVADKSAPLKKTFSRPKPSAPWFDEELVRCDFKRTRLYNKYTRCQSKEERPGLWKTFSEFRNKYKKLMRTKSAAYYKNMIDDLTVSSAKLWKKLNPYLNPNKKNGANYTDIAGSNPYFTAQDMVNAFSNFFASILNNIKFCSLSESRSYIKNHLNSSSELNSLLNAAPSFSFENITIESVSDALKKLDPCSSPGIVGIDSRILIHCAVELAPYLTQLFNKCLQSGIIPNEWKTAYITPILKPKSKKTLVSNYRPISLLPPIAKVFEGLIARQIETYFERNNLLSSNQFGFRRGRSCELALNTMVEYWIVLLQSFWTFQKLLTQ